MYLLDANVLSYVAPRRAPRSPTDALSSWIGRNAGGVWISAVTVAEIGFGIAELRRRGASRQAEVMDDWLSRTVEQFEHRLLPVTADIARRAGEMLSGAVGMGRNPGLEDAMIAATAEHHDLTVLTRNAADFAALGAGFLNPFDALPPDPG